MAFSLPKQYKSVGRLIKRYWLNYGGTDAIFSSPYLHLSIIIGVIIFPYSFDKSASLWWEFPLSILPNLIGFSLGGYAIFLTFGDEKFKRIMAHKELHQVNNEKSPSVYIAFSVAFLHFIMMQVISFILALIGKSLNFLPSTNIFWNILVYGYAILSFVIFLYAVSLALATALVIYRLVYTYDVYLRCDSNDK